jgi:hypothetical protein
LRAIPARAAVRAEAEEDRRSDRSLLEELLGLVRSHERGLQVLELSFQQLRASFQEKGTFVLSPALQQVAEDEAFQRRKDSMRQRFELFAREEAKRQPFKPLSDKEERLNADLEEG